jgi:hypothetical protein
MENRNLDLNESSAIGSMAVSQKWRERFAFIEANGAPGTPSYKAAIQALPFMKRFLFSWNFIAFFFGPIYFLVLGMWKKAIGLLGCVFVVFLLDVLILAATGKDLSRPLGIGLSFLFASIANYAYYLKEVKGRNGWNLFEGLRLW